MESDYRVPLQNAGHRSQVSFLRYKFRISILALGVLFNLLFAINSTFGCTTINEIRGPMLLSPTCSTTPVTYQYYLYPVLTGIPNPWKLFPANSGTIINQNTNSVSVTWNFAGSLIYDGGTVHDTIYMQECCPDPVPGTTIKVFDVDDRFYTISDLAIILGGTVNTVTQTIEINQKELFIQGMLNLKNTNVKFNDCKLWMGKGAIIFTRESVTHALPLYYPGLEMIKCVVKGVCGMWKGIDFDVDSYIKLTDVSFADAEYALGLEHCFSVLQMENCTFSKNFAGIKTGPFPSDQPSFGQLGTTPNLYESYFKNCTFDGTDPILFPTFNGQVGIPQGQKAFAGIILNDLITSIGYRSLPFSTTPGTSCTFKNLSFGIYAVNSQVDVHNCNFIQINNNPGYIHKGGTGFAIYSKMSGTNENVLNVGEVNTGSASNSNSFTDALYGIYAIGRIASIIKYNSFLHNGLNILDPVQSGISISMINAYKKSIVVQHNSFFEQEITSGGGFVSTGIYLSNNLPSINPTTISDNDFHNLRISIYGINTGGTDVSSFDFNIYENRIYSTLSHAQITNAGYFHYGIWLNAITYGTVRDNIIYRNVPLTQASSNFVNLMLAMNMKSTQYLDLKFNYITNYGTSMRFVSTCNFTNLVCNHFTSCVQGVNLSLAKMTNQGSLTDPWDNEWNNFPTLTATMYNRADGTVIFPFYWFNRGLSNSTGFSNKYSPEPVNQFVIIPNPIPNSTAPVCNGLPDLLLTGKIEAIVGDSISYLNYPEESQYMDKEFAYKMLKDDSTLRLVNPEFEAFYSALQQKNTGKFSEAEVDALNGNLSDALLKLNLVSDASIIESNRKYTEQVALQSEIDDNRELFQDEIDGLTPIANTNAWEGGPAVYIARATLMAEVDDRENNLRVRQTQTTPKAPTNFSIYPNPASDYLTVFFNQNDGNNVVAKISDLCGRMILQQNLQNNSINLENLNAGSYLISFYESNSYLSSARFTIVK